MKFILILLGITFSSIAIAVILPNKGTKYQDEAEIIQILFLQHQEKN